MGACKSLDMIDTRKLVCDSRMSEAEKGEASDVLKIAFDLDRSA